MKWYRYGRVLLFLALAACYVRFWTLAATPVLLVLMFAAVAWLPVCRGCESTWICLMTFLLMLPANLRAAWLYAKTLYASSLLDVVLMLMYFVIVFVALLSIEEIVCGVIGRMIWRRQSRIVPKKSEEERIPNIHDFEK